MLGYISDKIGRRKPVLIGGALVMLAASLAAVYVPAGAAFPRFPVALVLGIGSGAAMIPFSMIKEANPSASERDGRRRDELSRLPDDRRDVTVHLPPDAAI